MKLFSSLALFLATGLLARADLVIEQKLESAMINGNMTIKIKGDQARMDMPSPAGAVTILMNIKTGDMTTLISAQKIAMKMNMNDVRKQAGAEAASIEKPRDTGASEKIGDWTAEIYEFTASGTAGKLWAAKDFPNAQALKDQMNKLSAATSTSFDPSKLDVPGMVVKTQITTPAGVITTTLLKAAETPVADTEFAIPAGYQEMKMPGAPGAAAK